MSELNLKVSDERAAELQAIFESSHMGEFDADMGNLLSDRKTTLTEIARLNRQLGERDAKVQLILSALPTTLARVFIMGRDSGHEESVNGRYRPFRTEEHAEFQEEIADMMADGSLPELEEALKKAGAK